MKKTLQGHSGGEDVLDLFKFALAFEKSVFTEQVTILTIREINTG